MNVKVDPRKAAMARVYRILVALAEKAGDSERPTTDRPASTKPLETAQPR